MYLYYKRYLSYSNGQGIRCDPYLSYDEHISNIVSTGMSRLGQTNRVKHAFDNTILLTILNTLVISKLYYCSNVWVNTSGNNIQKLQAVQNFACRITSGIRTLNYDHALSKELRWLPIASELFYRSAIMAFKSMSSKLHDHVKYVQSSTLHNSLDPCIGGKLKKVL